MLLLRSWKYLYFTYLTVSFYFEFESSEEKREDLKQEKRCYSYFIRTKLQLPVRDRRDLTESASERTSFKGGKMH